MLQKVETQKRKHSVHAYFRKYRKRSVPWTEEIGFLKTADRKSESRNNHQFAAVVQDLTIQWILPVWNLNFTGDGEEINESFWNRQSSQELFVRTIHKKLQVLWRIIMESSSSYTSSIRDKWHRWKSRSTSKRRDISRIIAISIEWKLVVGFHGMLLCGYLMWIASRLSDFTDLTTESLLHCTLSLTVSVSFCLQFGW